MNQELIEKVAVDIALSREAGWSFDETAADAIEVVCNFLRDSIPDDSADDVREALGL